ncbi:MAG: hypothetical protein AB8F78_14360 [Saprospiraceae bacterium]
MIGSFKLLRIALLVFVLCSAFAKTQAQKVSPQAFSDWASRNGFQAGQDWRSYLFIAPGNMGPNALPVMVTVRGQADSSASFSVSGNYHTAPGDRATDLTAELRYPFGDRASIRVRYVLVERFNMSQQLALSRNVLRDELSGVAYGDVMVDGLFQAVKDHPTFPDFTIAVRVKTASGTGLEGMRHTDAPGYAFEGSFGKDYSLAKRDITLRPYASAGFFVWQMYDRETPQNDAYTYAIGCAQRFKKVHSFVEWAGYSGWMRTLDQPMVVRGGVSTNGRLSANLTVSKGIRDFKYLTVGAGLNFTW